MSLTTSPVTVGLSATTTFNIVDFMKFKQEKDIAPFPNMNEWNRAVQVAARAAMKALLISASHLAGLERLGLEEEGKLSAYPAIGVFKPLDPACPMKDSPKWRYKLYDALTLTLPGPVYYSPQYKSKLESKLKLGYGAFVGIFGRNGFDKLIEVATDYDCELLLLLALWCDLTISGGWGCRPLKVVMKESGALAHEVMGRLCAPITYSDAQFAVMVDIRERMVNKLLISMSTNMPPWYRMDSRIIRRTRMTGLYPVPNLPIRDLVCIDQLTELMTVSQGKVAVPAYYSLLDGMKCLGQTASRGKLWRPGNKRSYHHVNVDPPKNEHSPKREHSIVPPKNEKNTKRRHVEQLSLTDITGMNRSLSTTYSQDFNEDSLANQVHGVHLDRQDIIDILRTWKNVPQLRDYAQDLERHNGRHEIAFRALWNALGYPPQLLEQAGGVIVLSTCVLGWGLVAEWIAMTLTLNWGRQSFSSSDVTVLFNSISLRVDGTFWAPSLMLYTSLRDPHVLGADLFVKYEACLTDEDIELLCTDGVVCQMPSEYRDIDVTLTDVSFYRPYASERVCSLGSIVIVRSDDKYFALADWPERKLPDFCDSNSRQPTTTLRTYLRGVLVGVGADLRAALLDPHVVPLVATFNDPLMMLAVDMIGSRTHQVLLMTKWQTFYDCAQPGRLLIVHA